MFNYRFSKAESLIMCNNMIQHHTGLKFLKVFDKIGCKWLIAIGAKYKYIDKCLFVCCLQVADIGGQTNTDKQNCLS